MDKIEDINNGEIYIIKNIVNNKIWFKKFAKGFYVYKL